MKIYVIYFQGVQNVRTIRLLLKKWGQNEYLFYLFHFNQIVCSLQKVYKVPFWKMEQFHTSYFCELAESYFQS